MSNTALGFLAIAIFTLTISSLISPLIGISPIVPAGITVLALGLYGLDAAQWEGKGGTLLMAWLQERSPQFKQRVLHHEAGHFLAAHLLGMKILGYNLSRTAALQGNQTCTVGVEIDSQQISPAMLDRYCTVWMAGIAAEEHVYQNAEGGEDDLQKLKLATASCQNPEMQQRWALFRARTLITEHQVAFHALVTKMQQNASVEDCCAAINTNLSQ